MNPAFIGEWSPHVGTLAYDTHGNTTTLGNEDTYWYSADHGIYVKTSLRRTEKSGFGPGTQESEMVSQAIRK